MLESDVLQKADMPEAKGFVKSDRGRLFRRIPDNRDHLPKAKRFGSVNQSC